LEYGILRACQPAGAVAMAMAIVGGRFPPWKQPGRVLLVVVALYGLATVGIGLSTWLPLTGMLLFACGGLDNISVVIRLSMEQLLPDEVRGRVAAVQNVFIGMSNELGAAESGVAAHFLGTEPAIVAGGFAAIAVVVVVGCAGRRWLRCRRSRSGKHSSDDLGAEKLVTTAPRESGQ
jgi:hypothetical protein